MSILDGIKEKFGGHKTGDSTVLVMTPLGKSKAEKFDLPGAKWRVLSTLNENGPSSVHEIADETGMNADKVKAIAKSLLAGGYIRKAASTE